MLRGLSPLLQTCSKTLPVHKCLGFFRVKMYNGRMERQVQIHLYKVFTNCSPKSSNNLHSNQHSVWFHLPLHSYERLVWFIYLYMLNFPDFSLIFFHMYLNYLPIQSYARNLLMSFSRKSLCKIRRQSK